MGAVVGNVEPVSASADTRRNAFCVECSVIGQRTHYALCLHKIELRKSGRLKEGWSDCSSAIGKKQCPAMRMRDEETTKGVAVYFVERFRPIAGLIDTAKTLLGSVRKGTEVTQSVAQVGKSRVKDTSLDLGDIDDGGYAEAINQMAQPVEAKEGESLLDMARRMLKK